MSWTLAPNADLQWRSWEGEAIVFHPPSGDTHILHPLAAQALRYLEHHHADAAMITAHIADAFELESNDDLHRQMEQCVAQFVELGLIVDVEPGEPGEPGKSGLSGEPGPVG